MPRKHGPRPSVDVVTSIYEREPSVQARFKLTERRRRKRKKAQRRPKRERKPPRRRRPGPDPTECVSRRRMRCRGLWLCLACAAYSPTPFWCGCRWLGRSMEWVGNVYALDVLRARGVTQSSIARRINKTKQSVYSKARGAQGWRVWELRVVAEAVNMSAREMLNECGAADPWPTAPRGGETAEPRTACRRR